MVSLSSSLSLLDSLLIGNFQEEHHDLLLISQHTSMSNLLNTGTICMNTTKYFFTSNKIHQYPSDPSTCEKSKPCSNLLTWLSTCTSLFSRKLSFEIYYTIYARTVSNFSFFNIYNYCSILVCIQGYIWDSLDQTCLPCNVGSYQGDGNSCIQCPEGQTTNYIASTSISQCRKSKKLIYITHTYFRTGKKHFWEVPIRVTSVCQA